MLKNDGDKVTMCIVLDKALIAALDEKAKALCLNRSACARMILSQQLLSDSKPQGGEFP